jgi:alkylation response protein AidB-like acyl-CoA dehydrogenase
MPGGAQQGRRRSSWTSACGVEGGLDALDAAKVKMITTQLQGRVMDECVQLFGGWGYMTEYPIAWAFVDARMTRIGGGSIEVVKHIIGRSLFAEHRRRNPG